MTINSKFLDSPLDRFCSYKKAGLGEHEQGVIELRIVPIAT